MLETVGIIIGIIVGVFILIFGGRGLIDLARERRERKRQASLSTTTVVDQVETIASVKKPTPVGTLTEATTIGTQPLVGRGKEVSFLQEKVDAALEGKGSVVFITGQAGIGKTRLAREVRDYAQGKGFQWLEGKYDKTASLPYKAWADMVRSYLYQHEGRSLQSLAGPYAAQVAKIVPGAAGGAEGSGSVVPSNPEEERFHLFEGLAQFFVHISQEKPLVLFLDDLQWASSIELVHHLSRNIGNQRVVMLSSYRDDDLKQYSKLWNTLIAMNKERLFHSLPLRVLDEGDVGRLMAEHLSFRPLLYLGRGEEALADLPEAERLAGSQAFSSTVRFGWGALCLAYMGRLVEAQAQLSQYLKQLNLSAEHDETPAPILASLLEIAVLVEDREAASVLARRLTGTVALSTEFYLVNVARNLGGAAVLLGDRTLARANY